MTPIRLSIQWPDGPPSVDKGRVRMWNLLATDDFDADLGDWFEKAGDPAFVLHWAGVDIVLSSLEDLPAFATDFLELGRWLCWPNGPHTFYLQEQGFDLVAAVSLNDDLVEIEAKWSSAYRTPVSSLASHVTIGRADLADEVKGLLLQFEDILLAENRVCIQLSWVCRQLENAGGAFTAPAGQSEVGCEWCSPGPCRGG